MLIRPPAHEEMDRVFMMGFDVWGEELSESEYLDGCRNSSKYQKGQWFILVVDDEIVSSLITYKDEFGLCSKCYGVGSIATAPQFRRKGHAYRLINGVVENFERSGGRAIYLFSDIDPGFYEKLGFKRTHSVGSNLNSPCMVKIINKSSDLSDEPPTYF